MERIPESELPYVYADFQNADSQGRLRLNCVGTVNDLARQQVQLREGLGVMVYCEDADENGRPARLIAEGMVSYSQEEQCWVAHIDWNQIRHELTGSPSEPPEKAISVLPSDSSPASTSARPTSH